ncbi:MAG: Hint domain-containing protein [Candidatus Levyibacteriota bacterium]
MRILIGIVIFICVVTGLFFWFNSRNQDTGDIEGDAYFGQIKKGIQLGSYHKFQTENGIVTVGDTKSGGQIKPQITLSKWDDEAKMDIRYEMPKGSTTETLDNKIIWHDEKQEVFLKTIPKQQSTGPIAPTNALDNGKIRYISIKDASLKDVAASYQIFNKTKSTQPSILGVALKEAGYVFFGDRDVEIDLKSPRALPYPMVRINTEDKFKCPVIPTAENGTFAIFFYYPQIKSRGNEIKDMLVASINESLSKYGQKDFVKRQGDFLYYTKGLQIKPLGRIATDQNTVGLNVFVKTPYNTPLKDYMRPTLQLLRDKYIIPTGGLEELSKDIKPSIVEEIIPRFATHFKEKLESGVFTPDEAQTFDELKAQQTKEFVIANVKNDVPVDKFEFDIVLHQKPETNIFTYNIDTEGLDFLYQPPLTEEEKDQGLYRPENVVGSYAVYKSGSKSLYASQEEAQKYQTGKVFHIYRPKIIDSKGNWTWGVLDIDKNKSQLSIAIDQKWLDTASYPVTVDPTFGYTTQGASTIDVGNTIRGSHFTIGENGTLTSIAAFGGVGCFTGKTLVSMGNGLYKKIKDIKAKDVVKSYNAVTHKVENDTVLSVASHSPDEMGEYYLKIKTNNGKTVEITPNHPVYSEGKWVYAEYLKPEESLLNDTNSQIKITSIEKVYAKVPVYTLEIKKNHNFFTNFLVHNKKGSVFMKTALYKYSDNTQVAVSNELDVISTVQWQVFTASASLIASTDYWLYSWADSPGQVNIYYDTGGNGANKTVTYGAWPDPLTGQTTDNNKYSIYATYTASGNTKASFKGNVNLRGGVKFQ